MRITTRTTGHSGRIFTSSFSNLKEQTTTLTSAFFKMYFICSLLLLASSGTFRQEKYIVVCNLLPSLIVGRGGGRGSSIIARHKAPISNALGICSCSTNEVRAKQIVVQQRLACAVANGYITFISEHHQQEWLTSFATPAEQVIEMLALCPNQRKVKGRMMPYYMQYKASIHTNSKPSHRRSTHIAHHMTHIHQAHAHAQWHYKLTVGMLRRRHVRSVKYHSRRDMEAMETIDSLQFLSAINFFKPLPNDLTISKTSPKER